MKKEPEREPPGVAGGGAEPGGVRCRGSLPGAERSSAAGGTQRAPLPLPLRLPGPRPGGACAGSCAAAEPGGLPERWGCLIRPPRNRTPTAPQSPPDPALSITGTHRPARAGWARRQPQGGGGGG